MRVDEMDDAQPVRPSGEKVTLHNVHILDASSSMAGAKYSAAIEGINTEIEKTRKDPENLNYTLTVVEFKSDMPGKMNEIYFMNPLDKCKKDVKGSGASGLTPLYECVHRTVNKLIKHKRADDVVILTIFTDGGENDSSSEYSNPATLKALIDDVEKNHNFTVTFMGTKIDVEQMISKINIKPDNTLIHLNTSASIGQTYSMRSASLTEYSKGVVLGKKSTTEFFKNVKDDKQ